MKESGREMGVNLCFILFLLDGGWFLLVGFK